MRILADENIPLLHEFFQEFGEIVAVPGRTISAEQVRSADVLLVRSVTRVNADLLRGSKVGFVGTATIGCDHLDLEYLSQSGIAFSNAPGCNARSVVEYVLCALSVLSERLGLPWGRQRVGIVGLGNVGGQLESTLKALGFSVLGHDPFLERERSGLASLDEVLDCDLISLHTPLTRNGPHPTFHLLGADHLNRLRPDQILINTARGPVIDERALLEKMRREPQWPVVLDVWETEPRVNVELLGRVQLGSAHIAGYSLDGKMRGTEMIYQALCRHLGRPVRRRLENLMPAPPLRALEFSKTVTPLQALTTAMRACYDPRIDDSLLRATASLSDEERALAFDRLRKQYRVRREFSCTRIQLPAGQDETASLLRAAGFQVRVGGSA